MSLLITPLTRAQVVGATLSGAVKDQSGAVIPNAQISITNVATGVLRNIITNADGFYTAPNLLPGIYGVTVSASGFATQVRTGVNLEVGAQQVLNMTMTIGQVTETVQVTGEAPTVELSSSAISDVVGSTTIVELPLNGRSWTDLATLQPGVYAVTTQFAYSSGTGRGNRGFGAQISVSGARPQQNNYRLDGISINDYANGGPGSVIGGNLGVDAIQEFSVVTSNLSTEYGRTSAGVVNAITRSGTNQFHGSVYEFLRNSALDARNFFDKPQIPPFRRNQFGASGGGPIRKDKVFVFADYEGVRQSLGTTTVDTVPSAAARGGTLCSTPNTTPACTPTTIAISPSVQKYLPLWSLPNGGIKSGTNGDIGIFTFAAQAVVSENFFTTRVDDKFSDKDNLAATYMQDVTPYSFPDSLNDVLINDRTDRHIAILEETHTFGPTFVNSARIGYNRAAVISGAGVTPINPLAGDPSLSAIPGYNAAGVSVSGLTGFSGGVPGGGLNIYFWNSYQAYDDASWTHGTHFVKFGGAVERIDLNYSILQTRSGAFTFSNLSNFLNNIPSRFTLGFPGTLTPRGLRQSIFGTYIQDDWHARSNLTVNMGLRWEMTTVPTEVQGKLANLINITDPAPHLGSPFFSNSTLRNFEPRVGFAWDPFHNGKTAVRGGFGIFDMLPLPVEFMFRIATAAPFAVLGQVNSPTAGSFYTGALSQSGPQSNRETYIEQHPHRSYVMQRNLTVQRELTSGLTALVGYVGSNGVHLPFTIDDLNIVLPQSTPFGYLFPSPKGSGTKINSNFGAIAGVLFRDQSFYNALQVGVQQKMRHGILFQSSFTWGKSMDMGSATLAGDQFSNGISSLPWYDPKSFQSLSDYNVGRTLVISGSWQVPSAKSISGPAAWVTNGWELGAIYKASDGVPFTPTFSTSGDPQGLKSADPWDFPSRVSGPGCNNPTNPGNPTNYIKTQCFAVPTAPNAAFYAANCDPTHGVYPQCFNLRGNSGRNILIGPGLSNLDFSVFKNNYVRKISENFNVQFRAEFFNVLNHANFAPPATPGNTDIFNSTGAPTGVAGLLTSTTTTAREIQFALKVAW